MTNDERNPKPQFRKKLKCNRRVRHSDFDIPSDFVIRHSDLSIAVHGQEPEAGFKNPRRFGCGAELIHP